MPRLTPYPMCATITILSQSDCSRYPCITLNNDSFPFLLSQFFLLCTFLAYYSGYFSYRDQRVLVLPVPECRCMWGWCQRLQLSVPGWVYRRPLWNRYVTFRKKKCSLFVVHIRNCAITMKYVMWCVVIFI